MKSQDMESGVDIKYGKVDGYTDWRGNAAYKEKHGGWRASYFLFAVQTFETAAFSPIAVNMVTYLLLVMHFSLADAANTVTNFSGVACTLTLLGGFISDSYINRFWTMVIFGFIELMGFLFLAAQARFKNFQPPSCNVFDPTAVCEKAHGMHTSVFFISIYLVALGSGGLKSNIPSHGGDQFDEHNPRERSQMSSFFNWLFFWVCWGIVLGLTLLVWAQNNMGRDVGFFLSGISMFISWSSILLGASTFRNKIPEGSPLTRIAQVFVVSIRKRKLPLPEDPHELYEVSEKEASSKGHVLMKHTHQFRQAAAISSTAWLFFRFLDKAAIMEEKSVRHDAWHLCTTTQVEETKFIIRVLPIFASTIMLNCILAQLQTFSVAQGSTTDTSFGKHFNIPAASLPAIPALMLLVLLPFYEKAFVPLARRITGHNTGIRSLQRIGVGLVISAISMAIAALVEVKRKNVARDHHIISNPQAVVPLSVLWIAPQYFTFGLADLFTLVGLVEFYYSESPPGIRSLSSSMTFLSMAFGYFFSSVLVSIVNKVTESGPEHRGWLANDNLNLNKLDRFYWLLSILNILSFFHFLFWAWWYRYKEVSNVLKDSELFSERSKFENNPSSSPHSSFTPSLAEAPNV